MAKKSPEIMQQARVAIRKGDLAQARNLLRQVVHENPENHAAWLLLAKVTPSPKAASEYVKRAELLRPESQLVQRARMRLVKEGSHQTGERSNWRRRTTILAGTFALLLVLILAAAGVWAWDQVPALKSEQDVELAAAPTTAPTLELTPLPELLPVATPVLFPTPTIRPTLEAPSPTPEGSVDAAVEETAAAEEEIIEEEQVPEATPTEEEAVSDDPSGLRPPGVGAEERWIDVNLSTQSLVAYEGNTAVYDALISSGMQEFPTVTGQYRTYMKYASQDMNGYLLGYDYYIQDVPYVMYFFGDYAIHGAYWHNNFGIPMSHGCVNVSPEDAGWLFDWAPVGTTVNIHN